MVTLEATVECVDDKHFLKIHVESGVVTIPLSEDSANAVKSSFNQLLQRMRQGLFTIKLKEDGDDLFSMVANEYLTQLNREIKEVYKQMETYDLLQIEAA